MVSNENIESYKRTAEMFELVIEKYPKNKKNEVYKAKLDMLKMFLKDLGEKVTIDDAIVLPSVCHRVNAFDNNRCINCGAKAGHKCEKQTNVI
jgi:acetone carboxylase gamma subunit